jgi:hypothetical protein
VKELTSQIFNFINTHPETYQNANEETILNLKNHQGDYTIKKKKSINRVILDVIRESYVKNDPSILRTERYHLNDTGMFYKDEEQKRKEDGMKILTTQTAQFLGDYERKMQQDMIEAFFELRNLMNPFLSSESSQ